MLKRVLILLLLIVAARAQPGSWTFAPPNCSDPLINECVTEEESELSEEDQSDLDDVPIEEAEDFYATNPDDLFEGDMKDMSKEKLEEIEAAVASPPTPEQQEMEQADGVSGYAAIRNKDYHWPNARIPYAMSSRYNSRARRIIAKGIKYIESHTCIRFVPRRSHRDYIYIRPVSGCYSMVGRQRGQQTVSLPRNCLYHHTIVHELTHAIGFWHEQSRNDRDRYVAIQWGNIPRGQWHNFQSYSLRKITHLGVSYDYNSVMHYGAYAFSHNRRPTILARTGRRITLGNSRGYSEKDKQKVNKLYQCGGRKKRKGGRRRQSCVDKVTFCPHWARFCPRNYSNATAKYTRWYRFYCPKTCGYC